MRTKARRVPLPQAIILLLHGCCFFSSPFPIFIIIANIFHLHTNRFFILIPHLCQAEESKTKQYHGTREEISIQFAWKLFVGKSSITNFMLMIALHVRIVKNDRCCCRRRHHCHHLVRPRCFSACMQSTAFVRTLRFYLSVSIKCLAQKCLR